MSESRAVPATLLLAVTMIAGSIVGLSACKAYSDPDEAPAAVKPDTGPVPALQFAALAEFEERTDVTEYEYADDTVRLRKPHVFAIQDAKPSHDQHGYPAVMFVIADSDKEAFRKWTASLVTHQMAILLDGRVVAMPRVNSALPGAGILVDEARRWTVDEATSIAEHVRRQAQPAGK